MDKAVEKQTRTLKDLSLKDPIHELTRFDPEAYEMFTYSWKTGLATKIALITELSTLLPEYAKVRKDLKFCYILSYSKFHFVRFV